VSREEHGGRVDEFDPDTGRALKRGVASRGRDFAARFPGGAVLRFFDAHASRRRGSGLRGAAAGRCGDRATGRRRGRIWCCRADRGLVRNDDLRARQRLRGEVAGGYRRSREEGPGARDHRDAGTRCRACSARAQLKASQAQVEARKAEAEFSKTTNERWRDSPKGVVSEQERESKKADYESSEARLYAANAQVALDNRKVDQYSALTEFKQVRAPFDGTITERKIDIGNLVTAGSASTTTPCIAWRRPIRCASSSTCRRAPPEN
jgi:biotin carboxyl carrier protein